MKTNKNGQTLTDNYSTYSLGNTSNYKQTIDYSVSTILTKFISVTIEYMRFISEKITMKNKPHYKFIFERGFETLIHTFFVIFYYTKNLELTFYHSQKAYYFYIEYIEQISDDNVTFLQLSSRDAILFVYKKTIFEINNEYRKNNDDISQDEKNILSTVETYTHIYKIIIQFIINNKNFQYETKTAYINTCCDKIVCVSENLNKTKMKKGLVECIYLFTNFLADKQIDLSIFFVLLNEFSKKISSKKKIDDKVIKHKIYDLDINQFTDSNETNKIIDWIFKE